MAKAQSGDKVSVHYTGKLADGSTFDSSRGAEPLSFELGSGQLIPGFEQGVIGMEEGETKTIKIDAADAYGPRNQEQVVEVERSVFPENIDPEVGQRLQVQQAEGQPVAVTVKDVQEDKVTLDANHPLAGEDLTFEIELVSVD